jgi:hypothetical protein
MTHGFSELVVGGVLLAPFVWYAIVALAIVLALRPLLHRLGVPELFSDPSIAALGFYVVVLGLLTVLVSGDLP